MNIEEILNTQLWGNSLESILIVAGIFVVVLIGLHLFRGFVLKRLEKLAKRTQTDIDDRILRILENISGIFYWFLAFYLTVKMLRTGGELDTVLNKIFVVLVVWEVIKITQSIVNYGLDKTTRRDVTMLNGIRIVVKIALWATGLLLILSNWGINISTLVASLGIGGIAIALAAQNILGDLFSSFSIYFDKPFRIGDYIVIAGGSGSADGVVKRIGLKTTRIETLQGDELVVPNKALTEAQIHNYKKMKRRRVDFTFGVVYGTSPEKLKKIPSIVTQIIQKQELSEPFRTHFREFGDFSLNFSVVYYMITSDYDDYLNTQHDINLKIKEAFEKEKIEMAFPTQTLYVKKDA
ncbi:mechanosensitive ion channel family protein [Candidatus Gracilibacteria bacterium]|nr:mechanosensitive ion channel family protein [Candidatus Gracilibacteria bacterium]